MTTCDILGCNGKVMAHGKCEKHYMQAYYKKNREKLLSRVKNNYAANPEPAKQRTREWAKKNPERKKQADAAWAKNNPEKSREQRRAWTAKNRELINARHSAKRKANNEEFKKRDAKQREAHREEFRANLRAWKKRHPEKVAADGARRRATKHGATPAWANHFIIEEAYALAKLRTKVMGFKWHVDHIVPLRSRIVCGLHCEDNIQVIPAVVNFSKNNRHWPDMP